MGESYLDFEVQKLLFADKTTTEDLADRTAQKQQQTWESDNIVKSNSH